MTKTERLLKVFADAAKVGGGLHDAAELAFMMDEPATPAFNKFLADAAKKGLIRRLATGVYESLLTPPEPRRALYKLISKLRPGVLNYISLESQLSHSGDISQLLMDRVTLMTKGRSGTFTTPYGIIEFVHTKKPVPSLMPNLYFDPDAGIYRANRAQALADLKHCNRNLQMLEGADAE
jgi:hypothetical protein